MIKHVYKKRMCSRGVCFAFQGFEILEELEEAIQKKKPKNTLQMLSSKFYTAIPHDFGRRIPPVIDNAEGVQMKYDMLAVSDSKGCMCFFIHVLFFLNSCFTFS